MAVESYYQQSGLALFLVAGQAHYKAAVTAAAGSCCSVPHSTLIPGSDCCSCPNTSHAAIYRLQLDSIHSSRPHPSPSDL